MIAAEGQAARSIAAIAIREQGLERVDHGHGLKQPLQGVVLGKDRFAGLAPLPAFQRVALPLGLQDRLGLLWGFIDGEQHITAFGLGVGVRIGRGFKDGRRAVNRVQLRFQPSGQRILDRRFDHEFAVADQVAQRVARALRSGHFRNRKALVPKRVLPLVKQRLPGQGSQLDQVFIGT